jgi:hypothetical protein
MPEYGTIILQTYSSPSRFIRAGFLTFAVNLGYLGESYVGTQNQTQDTFLPIAKKLWQYLYNRILRAY